MTQETTSDFTAAFDAEDNEPTPRVTAPEAPQEPEQPAAEPAPAAPEPKPEEDDPFASLPPKVREILAEVPTLSHRLKSSEGRVAALQRDLAAAREELSKAKAPATPEPAAPRVEEIDALRGELPDVAKALDRVMQMATPKPAQPEAAPARDEPKQPEADPLDAEISLLESDQGYKQPKWREKMNSADYQLFLSLLPRDDRDKALSSSKAAEVASTLAKFDAYMARRTPAPAPTPAAPTQDRIASAAQPQGRARRAPVAPDPSDAFLQAFNDE